MGTSFDVVCAASLHRHVTIRDIVMKTLKKLWPQSDQVESARQSIVDRTDMMMREYLLKEAKKSSDPKSAECFAERWDYFAWYTYCEFIISSYHHRLFPARHDKPGLADICICSGLVPLGRGDLPVRLPRVRREPLRACRARVSSLLGVPDTQGSCSAECRQPHRLTCGYPPAASS